MVGKPLGRILKNLTFSLTARSIEVCAVHSDIFFEVFPNKHRPFRLSISLLDQTAKLPIPHGLVVFRMTEKGMDCAIAANAKPLTESPNPLARAINNTFSQSLAV